MAKSKKKAKAPAKKKSQKKQTKKVTRSTVRHEIVVRSAPTVITPSETELYEPLKDGQKMSLQKTWMSGNQLLKMLQSTPRNMVYHRKGRGGQVFPYVQGSYCVKWLNFVFGWNWDFKVVAHGVNGDHIWVQGELTVRSADNKHSVTKTQFGSAEVKYMKDKPHKPEYIVDYADDLKAASTDALKKCASMLGFASDIYGASSYKQETGKDPKPSAPEPAEVHQPAPEEPSVQLEGEVCKGVNGKGCEYGNDAESLPEAVAKFSKSRFGKPLCRDCQKDAK